MNTAGASRRSQAWLTGLIVVNSFLATWIISTNIPFDTIANQWRSLAFVCLALSGHVLFFGALAGLPAGMLRMATRSDRWMTVTAVVLQTLWIGLLIADAKVYALYRFHLNAMVVNLLFGGAVQDQVSFSLRMWGLIALAAGTLLALETAFARAWWWVLRRRPGLIGIRRIWWLVLALMLTGQSWLTYADARGDRAVISQLSFLPWAQSITMKRTLHRLGVQTVQTDELPDTSNTALAYPRRPLQCDAQPRLNVLVVLVESLRSDMLAAATMPNTWRYAQVSQNFDHHYSTGNATRFGLFGLMYGLPGGYWLAMLADQRGPVLIEQMLRDGYQMHIYGSAPLYNPEFDRTVFSQVRERIVNGQSQRTSAQRDRDLIERLQSDIRTHPQGQPFFGFVFLNSPHAPYDFPPDKVSPFTPVASEVNFLKLSPDHDPAPEFNRYRTAVHYTDELIGQLLTTLTHSPLGDDTVVLVTGDHGEEFNDLGLNYWGHNGNFSDFQLRTPFVLHWPGREPGRVSWTTSHEDLVPTLMRHALGCSNDSADYSTGADLLGPPQLHRALTVESWSQRGIRDGEQIYLFDKFGMATVMDPHYRPLPEAKVPAATVSRAWEQLTRFRGH